MEYQVQTLTGLATAGILALVLGQWLSVIQAIADAVNQTVAADPYSYSEAYREVLEVLNESIGAVVEGVEKALEEYNRTMPAVVAKSEAARAYVERLREALEEWRREFYDAYIADASAEARGAVNDVLELLREWAGRGNATLVEGAERLRRVLEGSGG